MIKAGCNHFGTIETENPPPLNAESGADWGGPRVLPAVDPAGAPAAHHDPVHPRLPQVLHAEGQDQPDLQALQPTGRRDSIQ